MEWHLEIEKIDFDIEHNASESNLKNIMLSKESRYKHKSIFFFIPFT